MIYSKGELMHPNVKYVKISEEQFSPKLIRVSLFTAGRYIPAGNRFDKRYVYDYELEFYTFSKGAMMIEDKVFPVEKGDIVFRRPGQLVQGILPYSCYLLCFDLLGNTGRNIETYDFGKPMPLQPYYLNDFLDSIPPLFHTPVEDVYMNIFDKILSESISSGKGSSLITKSLILQLLYQIYADTANDECKLLKNSPYYSRIKSSIDYMKKNIKNNIFLCDIARSANLSPTYFNKIFTETLKTTPNDYLTTLRMNAAKELLVRTNMPICDIALECGFSNIPYFSYVFKKYNDMPPLKFRKSYKYIY